jgi:LuxR family maltose regulon positive regulatory protein
MREPRLTNRQPIAHLTERQQQVLHCLSQGYHLKIIARDLAISENTLKTHLKAIYAKLNVTSRAQATMASKDLRQCDGNSR